MTVHLYQYYNIMESQTVSVQQQRHHVFVSGHSYVSRLNNYVNTNMNGGLGDLGDVHLVGIPGANVPRIWDNVRLNPILTYLHNYFVILQIGGNDLDAINVHPVEQANEILNLARRLMSEKVVKTVHVCQLLYRRRAVSSRFILRAGYNSLVDRVNRELEFLCQFFPKIIFWKHKKMSSNWHLMLNHDGTHLNDFGSKKYYRSIRGAVIQAIKG